MPTKDFLKRIICVLLAVVLCIGIFSGCTRIFDRGSDGATEQEVVQQEIEKPADEDEFDLLMDELFEDWVTSDSLTMNYFLADPYSMDIERPETSFGEVVTPELIQESREETQELSDRLAGFNYQNLRTDQKIVYDILSRNISLYKIMDQREDFSYYTGYIRPLNGIQVQFPILMAEFNFYTSDDIELYLDLLADTRRYFDDIIEYERERSRRGFFMNEGNVDSVIEQIESYLENREDNLLITVFDDRIDNYTGLGADQRESFKKRNKEIVLENVLPAYDTLLAAMKELRGVGANQGGLASLSGGKDYAHALLRLRVGTDRTADELADLLEEWVERTWAEIIDALHGESQLMNQWDTLGQIAEGTPESYISELQGHIANDFPQIDPTRLKVLEVHKSLQEHTSPAFYLAPAVDRFDDNVVYVNPSSVEDDDLFLFTALAHESYPGHMYQAVYFLQQSPHPVRIALSNTGYSEGWATYAEMRSYFFANMDEEEAKLMWNFRLFDSLLTSYADLGVNLLGWTIDDVAGLLAMINNNDRDVVERIYNMVTGVPLNSLMYSLGYIELTMFLNERERALGDSFELLDFHRYVLDFGPAPYPILRNYIEMSSITEEVAKPSKPSQPAA